MRSRPPRETPPSKRWRKPLLALLLAGGFVAFFALGGPRWLNLATLIEHRETLLTHAERNRALAVFGMIAVYTMVVAFSLPVAALFSLASGFLFGRWLGTVVCALSSILGATLVFLAVRYLFADAVRQRMGTRVRRIVAGFDRNAFHYLLFLRLVLIFPFWLVNLAAALTPIQVRTYVAATALGAVPVSFIYANLGTSLGRIDRPGQLLSAEVILSVALIGLLALVPVIMKKLRSPATLGDTP